MALGNQHPEQAVCQGTEVQTDLTLSLVLYLVLGAGKTSRNWAEPGQLGKFQAGSTGILLAALPPGAFLSFGEQSDIGIYLEPDFHNIFKRRKRSRTCELSP